jgi:MraZ protein
VDKSGKTLYIWGKNMFIGEYSHTIDSKKRLAVPSKFRKELGEQAIITRGIDKCLVIYPLVEWENFAKKLGSLPTTQNDSRKFSRIMLAGAMDSKLDNLGRILIPDYLKDYAFLKKNVVIIGVFNKLEVWDEENWQEYKKKTEMSVGDIAERLKEIGV